MRTRALLLSSLALTVTAAPAGMVGADTKVYFGSVCQGQEYWNLANEFSGTYNPWDSPVASVCPIDRDNTTNTNGLLDLEMSVFSSNGRMPCFAASSSRFNSRLKVVALETPGAGSHVLDFGATLNVSENKGTYAASCTLPARFNGAVSGVSSIYINEP